MFERSLATVLNHLLVDEAWARDRLRPFAGAVIRIVVPPLAPREIAIATDGLVAPAGPEQTPTLSITLPAAALARFPADRAGAARMARFEGDVDLAQALEFVAGRLSWDAEEDLARVVGDVAAHRVASAGRALLDWQRDAARRLAENAREYLTDETDLVISPAEARRFGDDVIALRDALARLEQRVAHLERPRAASPPAPGNA